MDCRAQAAAGQDPLLARDAFRARLRDQVFEFAERAGGVSMYQRIGRFPACWSFEALKGTLAEDGWFYVGWVQLDLREKPEGDLAAVQDEPYGGQVRYAQTVWQDDFEAFIRGRGLLTPVDESSSE
ncbi:MAG: hypothetical protein AMK73_01180 [Planctomycetes bacterium SM23_32]|nr:MAG: hypothetical protein AMK73_01180 [Planctomycetes bacterium SM23_32]